MASMSVSNAGRSVGVDVTAIVPFISDDTSEDWVTGQEQFDSYDPINLEIAVDLVNELTVEQAYGRPVERPDPFAAIERTLAVDPPFPALARSDVPRLMDLARRLRDSFRSLQKGDLDAAATQLNELLAAHPAHPHLEKDHGHWRLHHHPADAALVPQVTAVCAEAMARVVGAGASSRFGSCDAEQCDRVFFDASKNGSRRFCSTTCQNRVKAAAFRRRRRRS